ncbi:putative mucin/carbohydrate-binding domain-containing protein [Clostridium frigidicarnis]|uniref:Putative mucin or carbohydrate-binding module n=1 Tax=Clostridium frigidicarnis TaxID=84698 RepID=A0A1I0XCL3_9CLOT|nr:putative mucin/carbohydrate-binding domain-containing protein [Clostridium frigidicarnis]SFA98721.1 Putative mucin or carbohydrate-binding module [Clostridium frigidicarnis]
MKNGNSHVDFIDSYASILIQNTKKETIYSKDFIGTTNYPKNSEIVALEEGTLITFKYLEATDRLQIVNTENEAKLQKGTSVTYEVVASALKKIS